MGQVQCSNRIINITQMYVNKNLIFHIMQSHTVKFKHKSNYKFAIKSDNLNMAHKSKFSSTRNN